jgi:hypothetical protein
MMRRSLSALVLTAALGASAVPAVARADAREVRVYDRRYHDYHRWNEGEERTYRQYLHDRHQSYRAYKRQERARQNAYWRWRHRQLEHERHEYREHH